ncbi:FxSxx-COOH cyclophane-containing RiPP peptide [Streptomyces sp. NPDC014779]|uniref:FxSxx-COOH cyclophane-containing RiPP peptide n=1 Tax=unclassified Streptomyces TaxID=2593676 RepID=UPI0036F995A6
MRAGPLERGPDVVPAAWEHRGEGESPAAWDDPAGPADLTELAALPAGLPANLPAGLLPDLAGLPLDELLDAPNPVLARAARRVLDRLTADEAPLAAYDSSAVPTDDTPV